MANYVCMRFLAGLFRQHSQILAEELMNSALSIFILVILLCLWDRIINIISVRMKLPSVKSGKFGSSISLSTELTLRPLCSQQLNSFTVKFQAGLFSERRSQILAKELINSAL